MSFFQLRFLFSLETYVQYFVDVVLVPNDKIYIGYTGNLEQRFLSHNELSRKGYTVEFRPWEIAFSEEYTTKREAMAREKFLKTGKGREFVWSELRRIGLIST